MGTFVYQAIELAAIAAAVLLGHVLTTGRRQKIAFGALAGVSFILLGWQGWRAARSRHQAEEQAAKALAQNAEALKKAEEDAAEARRETLRYQDALLKLTGHQPAQNPSQASSSAGSGASNTANPATARALTDEQKSQLSKLLKKMGPHSIVVRYAQGNDESQHYADAFAAVLRDAGWTFRSPKFILWEQYPRGVVILVPDLTAVPRDADAFSGILNQVGIDVRWSEEPSLDPGTFDLLVGLP
ncbi:MAG TPA: hypothetical protein VG204_11085 [Terriglobia bacterium]|nr:hypothetical protein [Terriglobia bacterium]